MFDVKIHKERYRNGDSFVIERMKVMAKKRSKRREGKRQK